tara:strand:- start:170 stop:472 length:303 start_codon:yes stop_codon:yes gene_type:complete
MRQEVPKFSLVHALYESIIIKNLNNHKAFNQKSLTQHEYSFELNFKDKFNHPYTIIEKNPNEVMSHLETLFKMDRYKDISLDIVTDHPRILIDRYTVTRN